MIRSTFGAPLGGTIRGGHQVFDPSSVSLMTPPNFGGGAGSWLPGTVVVALGVPSTPVTSWACAALKEMAVSAVNASASFIIIGGTSISEGGRDVKGKILVREP